MPLSKLNSRWKMAMARAFWRRTAAEAPHLPMSQLREVRAEARELRHHAQSVIAAADYRLARPHIGSTAFPTPYGTDWSWRPDIWKQPLLEQGIASVGNRAMLGNGVTAFHDCNRAEICLRQIRNQRSEDLAPFGLRMDVFRFDGNFLSLAFDLDPTVVEGLEKRHIIRLDTIIGLEKQIQIFARLNIQQGPNTEQMVQQLPLDEADIQVEFDLAYMEINENRLEKAWVDLIFDDPGMSEVVIHDLFFSRRVRADL